MAFAQAHGFKIGTVNVDQHHHYGHLPLVPPSDPMQLLRDARAVEATHTSKTAAYAPKCRPGSRAKVTQDIMNWITTDSARISSAGTPTSILWFHGPAGGGKTCIMREVVALREVGAAYSVLLLFNKGCWARQRDAICGHHRLSICQERRSAGGHVAGHTRET